MITANKSTSTTLKGIKKAKTIEHFHFHWKIHFIGNMGDITTTKQIYAADITNINRTGIFFISATIFQ